MCIRDRTDAHPVFASRMKKRIREGGAKVIVIDPRKTDMVRTPHVEASYHLPLKPGTNVAIVNALAHVIVTEGLANEMRGTGVAVTAVLPGWVHTEFHQRAGINASKLPAVVWLKAEDLARDALDDNSHGKVISVPSKRWNAAYLIGRHLPRSAIRGLSRKLSNSRKSPDG